MLWLHVATATDVYAIETLNGLNRWCIVWYCQRCC
jgi:hypothetical protein